LIDPATKAINSSAVTPNFAILYLVPRLELGNE